MIQKFKDGAVLMTGDDMFKFLMSGNPKVYPSCDVCVNEDSDACYGCSMWDKDSGCSCHINPPCGFCENNHFEYAPYIVDYFVYSSSGKRLNGFKTSKEVYDKFKTLKERSFYLNTETLKTTGENIFYLTDGGEEDVIIKISPNRNIKEMFEKMIVEFFNDEKKEPPHA